MIARLLGWPTFWPGRGKAPAGAARRALPPEPPVAVALTGVNEARDALAVAALMRGTMSLDKADALVECLTPYRARLLLRTRVNPLDGLAGQDESRLMETMLRYCSPMLVDGVLPGARDYLLARLVDDRPAGAPPGPDAAPGPLPSVFEVAGAMRRIVGVLNGAGRGMLVELSGLCEKEVRRRTERLVHDAGPISRERIDELARGLLRAEVLTMVLDALGSCSGLEQTRFQSLRLARYALRCASEALEGFVDDRDLKSLHSSLSVLAAVDGLIVIVLRILDAQKESREETTPFVEPADRVAMGRYLHAAGRLADMLLDMVGRAAVTPRIDDLFFEALIRQIAWLHRFCAHCGHDERPAGLDVLERSLVDRSAHLARFAGDALVEATMSGRTDVSKLATLVNRAEAIAELLLDMNRPEELEALALRIVVVRDTLAEAVPPAA